MIPVDIGRHMSVIDRDHTVLDAAQLRPGWLWTAFSRVARLVSRSSAEWALTQFLSMAGSDRGRSTRTVVYAP
jgi:hypothetical protein